MKSIVEFSTTGCSEYYQTRLVTKVMGIKNPEMINNYKDTFTQTSPRLTSHKSLGNVKAQIQTLPVPTLLLKCPQQLSEDLEHNSLESNHLYPLQ